ncbi:hypothetical protein [Flectobacillus roseus]|uniref:hypothetical protein n=1 Tax=Flectobacillus roseus TaxID=502259 RepID=UPI0024B86942|nr:hypothetical protein [Flectobacillus roseus]MDI9868763.1 hypothetical protein [Flectobacillus roseus]
MIIQINFQFQLNTVSNIILLVAVLIMGIVQIVSLGRNRSKGRWRVKVLLNFLLWISILGWILQPTFTRSSDSNQILIYQQNIPHTNLQHWQDSLHIAESFTEKELLQAINEHPAWITQIGTVYLAGTHFESTLLNQLLDKEWKWLPAWNSNQLQSIRWEGVLYRGDLQRVSGKILSEQKQVLSLKIGEQVLDSLMLKKGLVDFNLIFPAFVKGKAKCELWLGEKLLQPIHFAVMEKSAKSVLVLQSNPDFESKTLADWMGKRGYKVEIWTKVAKNTQNQFQINTKQSLKSYDLIVTDPNLAADARVKKVLGENKGVLIINLSNPETETRIINQALGTQWRLTKSSTQEAILLSNDLTALPYQIQPNAWQKSLKEYPIAVQRQKGGVGLSLLNETYPLMLSGDSVTYNKIWASTLEAVLPSDPISVQVNAPVFVNIPTQIRLNTLKKNIDWQVGEDTLKPSVSSLNSQNEYQNYRFTKTGWQPLFDSLSVYVEDSTQDLAYLQRLKMYVGNNFSEKKQKNIDISIARQSSLSPWLWWGLILFIFTALWVEPKW